MIDETSSKKTPNKSSSLLKFIKDHSMTLMSLAIVYFMQIWVAFAFERMYPNSLYIMYISKHYCPDGSCAGAADFISSFFSSVFVEFSLPVKVLIIIVILFSKELEGWKSKLKWILWNIFFEYIYFILLVVAVIPLPTI